MTIQQHCDTCNEYFYTITELRNQLSKVGFIILQPAEFKSLDNWLGEKNVNFWTYHSNNLINVLMPYDFDILAQIAASELCLLQIANGKISLHASSKKFPNLPK